MSVLSSQRYLSVWLRRLSTDRIERRLSASADEPRVVVASIESAQRITALNDAAVRLGLRAGLALADARARYPSLPVVEADSEADRRLLEMIADWCDRYTPLVGLDPPDGLFLDITGCAHLFGGEAALTNDLLTRLARQGFAARAAVADTVGCAWAVARYGAHPPGQAYLRHPEVLGQRPSLEGRRPQNSGKDLEPHPSRLASLAPQDDGVGNVFVEAAGKTEAAMLLLPIAALRIDAETVADLKTAGLVTVADLASRPRAPFAARFGEELLRRLDQALGRADEPISPRLPVPLALAEQRFPEPIAHEDDVLGTIEHLAGRLAVALERRGEGGRLFQVALFRADGAVHRLELGTGAPLRDPARVRKLFAERLAVLGDACDPGFGYDMVRLSALVAERSDPAQTGLGGGDHAEELSHLIDRLGARFGLRRVTRLVPQDTHIPEYAVAAVPAHAVSRHPEVRDREVVEPRKATARASQCPSSFDARLRGAIQDDGSQDSLAAPRPIRLFERPEPIEATAQVPDGPPLFFRWRQVRHQIAHAEGPERIALEWWRDGEGNRLTRDYFRVESRDGARVWLYREGLYGRETPSPRWFLHGLLA